MRCFHKLKLVTIVMPVLRTFSLGPPHSSCFASKGKKMIVSLSMQLTSGSSNRNNTYCIIVIFFGEYYFYRYTICASSGMYYVHYCIDYTQSVYHTQRWRAKKYYISEEFANQLTEFIHRISQSRTLKGNNCILTIIYNELLFISLMFFLANEIVQFTFFYLSGNLKEIIMN